jgi:hypothetical protein
MHPYRWNRRASPTRHSTPKYSRILGIAFSLGENNLEHLSKSFSTAKQGDWELESYYDDVGDEYIREHVIILGEKPLDVMFIMFCHLVRLCGENHQTPGPLGLAKICRLASTLRRSKLFRSLVLYDNHIKARNEGELLLGALIPLAELYEACQQLWEQCSDESWRTALQAITISEVGEVTYEGLGERFGLMDAEHANGIGPILSTEQAETRASPPNRNSKPHSSQTLMHPEIRLAFNLLSMGYHGLICFSMSLPSSFLSRYWFKALNEILEQMNSSTRFYLPHGRGVIKSHLWYGMSGATVVDDHMKEMIRKDAKRILQRSIKVSRS